MTSPEQTRPRRAGATNTQEARARDVSQAAWDALARGTIRKLMRGLIHVIDARTSPICLDLAARKPVVEVDEDFDTLLGPQREPPFHDSCRSLVVMVIPDDVEPHGAEEREVEAEQRARDEKPRQRKPSRKQRRQRRREVERDVERRRREERERRRQEREAERERRARQDPGFERADGLSLAPKSTQSPASRPLPSALRPQRTSLREWVDTAAELNRSHDRTADDDDAMRILLRRQRWSGAPVVVDAQRFALEQAGTAEAVLHRGISPDTRSAGDYAQEFAYGHLFLGRGAGGVGVYTALDAETAAQYAGPDGAVVRALPLAGSRVVDAEQLLALRRRELATLTEREQRSLRVITEDPGRLAVALGYDGVRYPDGTVLVVNRTALAVEEPT